MKVLVIAKCGLAPIGDFTHIHINVTNNNYVNIYVGTYNGIYYAGVNRDNELFLLVEGEDTPTTHDLIDKTVVGTEYKVSYDDVKINECIALLQKYWDNMVQNDWEHWLVDLISETNAGKTEEEEGGDSEDMG